ncbi:MAG: PorT family protein [Bacteroidota bacterium]|nr:PorT family protein [Bacteroidota bacterium]
MDENLHDIEDLFYSGLNDNEETPSPEAWNKVDKRLDKETVISIKKKYAMVKRIAILLLLLLGISIYEGEKISNNVVRNNNTNPVNHKISIADDDKTQNKTSETAAGITAEPGKKKSVTKQIIEQTDLVNAKQKLANEPDEITYKKDASNKKHIIQHSQSENNNQKNAGVLNSAGQARLTSKPLARPELKNEPHGEDSRYFAANKNAVEPRQVPSLKSPRHLLLENMMLQAKDSIDIKHSLWKLLAPETNIINTTNSSIAKKTKHAEKLSRFSSITPFFSPDIAWYHLLDANVNNQSTSANYLESEEKHEFSSTYGVVADYKINKHWGLQSGITLSNTNIVTDPEIIYAEPDNNGSIKYRINTSSGYGYVLPSFSANPAIGDSLYAFTSTHSLQYIGIPMSATYSIIKNKFLFGLTTGISANYLTKARLETTVEKGFDNSLETVKNIQGLKKIYFSGLAGIELDFQLNKKISVAFAPAFRFALNSINKNAPVKSYPMTFGSVVGLKIGL